MSAPQGVLVQEPPALVRRPSGSWKWWVVGLLFLATVLNYLDRQTLAICAPLIKREFSLSEEQYGQLVSAFRWAYAGLQVPAGLLADRFSVRFLYPAAVVLWSLAGAAAFWAGSFRTLAGTRVALGVGEAFNWPCALRVTANILPPQDRGLGNGIFQSGTAVGPLIAPLFIGPLAQVYGWRLAFLVVGALGAIWVVLWLLVTGGRRSPRAVDAAPPSTGTPAASRRVLPQLAQLMRSPAFWLLLLAACTINPCLYFLADWLPNYLNRQRGLDLVWAGLATIPVFFGLDLGNVGGGGLVKGLMARGWSLRGARGTTVSLAALLALCAIPANFVPSPYLAVGLLGLAGFGIAAIMSNWLTCIQEVSFAAVGLTMGLLGASGQAVGAVVNPLIGRYVDRTGHYNFIFVVLGLLPAVTVAALLLCDRIMASRRA